MTVLMTPTPETRADAGSRRRRSSNTRERWQVGLDWRRPMFRTYFRTCRIFRLRTSGLWLRRQTLHLYGKTGRAAAARWSHLTAIANSVEVVEISFAKRESP